MHHVHRSLASTAPVTTAKQGTAMGLRLLKRPQNPDCVFCKMVLNQNPTSKYPNALSVYIQIQNCGRNFYPRNKRKPHYVAHSVISNPATSAPTSTENCLLPHARMFSNNILFQFLWCASMAQRRKQSTFFVCVICEPECIHIHWKIFKQQHLYRESAELAKTKVLLACRGESLHLAVEPKLIISFYFCSLAGSWANSAGSCTALLELQE